MKTTTGIYRDQAGLTRAVRELLGTSVPADAVGVSLRDASGRTLQEVPVRAEPGVVRGLLVGAAVGAAVGGLAFLLMVVDVLPPGREILTSDPVRWATRLVFGIAAAAVPLGGLLGMGRWRMRTLLDPDDVERVDAMVVTVRSDELARVAREVFQRTGADAIGEEQPPEERSPGGQALEEKQPARP
jgi:hypothetical protein